MIKNSKVIEEKVKKFTMPISMTLTTLTTPTTGKRDYTSSTELKRQEKNSVLTLLDTFILS